MDGAALSPGGKANRSIYAAPRSTVGSGAHLIYLYTNYEEQTGQAGSFCPVPEL